MEELRLNTIEEAVEDFRKGEFVIVVDDEDRENEGDLICAAEMITPEMVNFMLKNARGLLCAPVTISRSQELDFHRDRRQARRLHNRCLCPRPCRDHQGTGCPHLET